MLSGRVLHAGGPTLGFILYCHCLEILNKFEQGSLHFYSSLRPTNYIASSERYHSPRHGTDGGDELGSHYQRISNK